MKVKKPFGLLNKAGDKVRTSLIINAEVHHRVRELTGFEFGGFSHFLELSLRSFLPFVESYYLAHKKKFKNFDNVLLSIAKDTETEFDYEALGRKMVSLIQEKTKEVFDGK
ncbi:MAG: hypothetical protein LBE18_01490 [Planctomycetaceae bacterium]|jgi:hypothetical protein|nr:hypothetical protein [Planctomycetaceae bacterium]